MEYHIPVLLNESVAGLALGGSGIYVDVTFGGGGHTKEILKKLGSGRLIAFDQDEDAVANKIEDDRFLLIRQNFRFLKNYLKIHNILSINGLLADLGISSHQIDQADRGFSTRFEAELDLRMDKKNKLSAKDIINTYPDTELMRIFRQYGELDQAYRIGKTIAQKRIESPINTTTELKNALASLVFKGKENKFFAQVFQALRIEVNQELESLKDMLKQALDMLAPKGRLVVISYNSLEDRIVKDFMRSGNFEGIIEKDFYGNVLSPLKPLNRKVIIPSEEELAINNRARSAKLRIAERV